ncbi:MAG TPA: MASE1 domain-containing protein [Candidatus Angelobacter sp.]
MTLPGRWAALIYPAVFFVAYHYAMRLTPDMASPFWFPDSVLLCALLLSPRSTWWFYLLTALPLRMFGSATEGLPMRFLAACYAIDSAKGLLSAVLIQRLIGRKLRFDSLRQFFAYSLIAVLGVPLLSSIGGGAVRHSLGHGFLDAARQWFLGDALTALLLTPMILCLAATDWRKVLALPRKLYWEAACLVAALSFTGYLSLVRIADDSPVQVYLPMPFLLWAAVRFGPLGAACSLSAIGTLAIFGLFQGQGPFAEIPLSAAVQSFQLFMIVISLPLLALATVIKEQQAGAAALSQSEERLHQLSARLIDSQEWERKLIGEQLHEDVAQRVAALSIGLSSLAQSSGISAKAKAESSRLRQHAAEIVHDLSRLSRRLRPPSLETVGLSLALQILVEQINNDPEVTVTYEQVGQPAMLPWEVAVSLYRVVQESLDNALAHSGALNITVGLFCENGSCELRVCDDGAGFDLDFAASHGLGLAGMKERMRNIGGTLMIDTIPGRGTEIIATIPSSSPRLFAATAAS